MINRLKGMIPGSIKRPAWRILLNVKDSIAYRRTRGRLSKWDLKHIVFVCKGNICRSVFAEYYLKSLVPEGTLKIESCGLDVDQGILSPPEAVQIGIEFGLDLEKHRSKAISACELQNVDLIVPMEYRQYIRLKAMFPVYKGKILVLRDFAPWPDRLLCNIFDPFGLGESEFRRCFCLMQKALDKLEKHLLIENRK